jgi:hypothetical protein
VNMEVDATQGSGHNSSVAATSFSNLVVAVTPYNPNPRTPQAKAIVEAARVRSPGLFANPLDLQAPSLVVDLVEKVAPLPPSVVLVRSGQATPSEEAIAGLAHAHAVASPVEDQVIVPSTEGGGVSTTPLPSPGTRRLNAEARQGPGADPSFEGHVEGESSTAAEGGSTPPLPSPGTGLHPMLLSCSEPREGPASPLPSFGSVVMDAAEGALASATINAPAAGAGERPAAVDRGVTSPMLTPQVPPMLTDAKERPAATPLSFGLELANVAAVVSDLAVQDTSATCTSPCEFAVSAASSLSASTTSSTLSTSPKKMAPPRRQLPAPQRRSSRYATDADGAKVTDEDTLTKAMRRKA